MSSATNRLSFVAALLLPLAAIAAVTLTEATQINLLRGSRTVATHTSWESCLDDARARAKAETRTSGTLTFTCQTERRRIVAAYSANPPAPPPPAPVDCAVSSWSSWSGGAWSACSSGTQSRTETRTRTIVTAAANGGAACPSLSEMRTATQACTEPQPEPPPVAGTLVEGQVLTLTGSWDARADTTPYLFDDFEGGTVGQTTAGKSAKAGTWGGGNDGQAKLVVYDSKRAFGQRSAYMAYRPGGRYTGNLVAYFPSGIQSGQKIYQTWHYNYTRLGGLSRNWKPFRWTSRNDMSGREFYLQYYCRTNGAQFVLYGGSGRYIGDKIQSLPSQNEWHRIEILYHESGSGQSNGGLKLIQDDHDMTLVNEGSAIGLTGYRTKGSGEDAEPFKELYFPHYWADDGVPDCPANPGADMYVDHAITDTSWAQTHLSDNAECKPSRKWITLRQRVRTATRIEAEIAKGPFQSGDKAYGCVRRGDSGALVPTGLAGTF